MGEEPSDGTRASAEAGEPLAELPPAGARAASRVSGTEVSRALRTARRVAQARRALWSSTRASQTILEAAMLCGGSSSGTSSGGNVTGSRSPEEGKLPTPTPGMRGSDGGGATGERRARNAPP
jgi:hypothetical protein